VVEAIATCAGKLFERSFAVLNLGCGRRIKTFEYATTLVKALQSQSEIIPIDSSLLKQIYMRTLSRPGG
jgi:hypothetical protein